MPSGELESTLQQIWDDLSQTTINKAINDFRKRLNAYAFRPMVDIMSILCEVVALNTA